VNRFIPICLALLAGLLVSPCEVHAQAQAGPGYQVRALDGVNRLGPHFVALPRPHANTALGFVYHEDEGALYAGTCNSLCTPSARVATGADRGRFVSAALRPTLNNRPFAAFYNASSRDLEAVDCLDSNCDFSSLRVLDTAGDVGAGTATVIEPASGIPLVAYYDASNGDLRLYRCGNAVCDTGNSQLVDATADSGRAPVALFAQGVLLIAYERGTEVWLARANAPYLSFTVSRVADGGAPVLVEWSGSVEILFRAANGALDRRRCSDPACSFLNTPGALSAAPGSGLAPSATVLTDGRLFVSHRHAGSGDLMGLICADPGCASPQSFLLQPGADTGQRSQALGYADGRPLVLFDAAGHILRSSQCTNTACSSIFRSIASNGVVASRARLALRSDGRAVAIWTRLRGPRMALCADAACSSFEVREPQSANSDSSTPSVAIRPDGRPFAFYSYVGGNAAWDCADVDCSSGTLREIGAAGSGVGFHTVLAIRPDGRPLLAYTRSQGATREVRVYSCSDVGCSSGSEHLLADESAGAPTIDGLNIAMGPDGRARLAWTLGTGSGGSLRFALCADANCSSAAVRSLNASTTFYQVPLSVRTDGRAVLLESLAGGRNLLTCDNPACTSLARVQVPNLFEIASSLALDAAQSPIYSVGNIALGGFWRCPDPACTSPERELSILDSGAPNRGFEGPLVLNAQQRPVQVFSEQDLRDVWLATPLAPAIFSNGFED
jgi:hypothetical protein